MLQTFFSFSFVLFFLLKFIRITDEELIYHTYTGYSFYLVFFCPVFVSFLLFFFSFFFLINATQNFENFGDVFSSPFSSFKEV